MVFHSFVAAKRGMDMNPIKLIMIEKNSMECLRWVNITPFNSSSLGNRNNVSAGSISVLILPKGNIPTINRSKTARGSTAPEETVSTYSEYVNPNAPTNNKRAKTKWSFKMYFKNFDNLL